MADLYYTIEAPSEAQYTEKRSKFLAYAFPVSAAAEAKEYVAQMQKRYYDARHVCWAYMLGSARNDFQSNDNGEPSGTAGKPILGQINSLGLTNVLVVVVRYFGGIKLGTSGLIVAYRTAARMALEAASVVERHDMARVSFHFPYPAMNAAMKLTKDFDVAIVDRCFDNTCSMTLEINADAAPLLRARIADIDGATLADDNR
ncbi:MAG: IMPACT family protein [Muribaculaceae bacterium]|nr:IMPACT family protein [Muribaculaceae bacterium]